MSYNNKKENVKSLVFDYTPHLKQREIHLACNKKDGFYVICAAGRQSGKSLAGKYQAIYWALSEQSQLIWYVCPSEGQAKIVFREIYQILYDKGLVDHKNQSKGSIFVELTNKSRIEFKSVASEDSLRGSSINYLILDEASFLQQQTIEEIILPSMASAGKKILAISSPKGKNFFYEMYLKGFPQQKTYNKDFTSFMFTSYDNPRANKELIASFKSSLPEAIFRQEFLCEFIDSNSVFPNITELATLKPSNVCIQGDTYYIGVDIAFVNDYTVITVLNQKKEMICFDRFRQTDIKEVVGRIKRMNDIFHPKKLVVESNNQGLPVIILLREAKVKVEEFSTQTNSKSDLINDLIASFSAKEIHILNDDTLKEELNSFVFSYSQTGKIRFESSGSHDDMVMSLALTNFALSKSQAIGNYFVYSDTPQQTNTTNTGFIKDKIKNNDFSGIQFPTLRRNLDKEHENLQD